MGIETALCEMYALLSYKSESCAPPLTNLFLLLRNFANTAMHTISTNIKRIANVPIPAMSPTVSGGRATGVDAVVDISESVVCVDGAVVLVVSTIAGCDGGEELEEGVGVGYTKKVCSC